jgi:hypothetical protein
VINIGDRLCGGGFDGDLVSEGLEFADEPAFACFGVVDAAGEVVRAEVAVGRGFGEYMPNDDDQSVCGGDCRLLAALFSEAAVKPAELCANVGAGAPRGPGAFDENLAQLFAAFPSLA